MNVHEYQAKELLQKFDVATTRGRVASTLDEAEQIARELGDGEVVVKAQIHAGGRGKGTFAKRQRKCAMSQQRCLVRSWSRIRQDRLVAR
jgi:succinyl-CoA synthetase beta subunit